MTIKIIGTSHVSRRSIKEVKETIERLRPACIGVELCPARFHALSSKQKPNLRYGLLVWVFSWLQRKLGERVGVLPGSEMLAAIEAGRKVGAKIFFIDKNIEEIVYSLKKIPVREKIKIFGSLLFLPFARAKITSVEQVLREMREQFPVLYRVLVAERNLFMAEQAKRLEKEFGSVVIVVGLGHKKGIEKLLKE